MNSYLEIYITQLSKYFLAAFVVVYALITCIILLRNDEKHNNGFLYWIQVILMFAFHFTAFLCICFQTGEMDYLVFYLFQQLLLFGIIFLMRALYPTGDRLITNNMCMLMSIGFVMLTRISYSKAVRQFFIVAISIIICMGIPFAIRKFRFLYKFKWIYGIVGIVALGAVLIAGSVTYGANISYTLGGITFQPSEIVKIIFVFFVASGFCRSRSIKEVLITGSFALAHVLILVASRDLGSGLIFAVVYIIMVFVATGKIIYMFLGAAGCAVASCLAYKVFSHVQVRVQAFIDPWSVIDDSGYQITQSLFAISSGSTWGVGLFEGNPSSIPFVEDDFIFSAIVQEMGFVLGIGLIAICLLSFIRFLQVSAELNSMFYRLLAVGLGTSYIFQVFLTIGGGVKFIPLTGVTLPFISYGGTSILTSIVLFEVEQGLVLTLQEERRFYEEERMMQEDYYEAQDI